MMSNLHVSETGNEIIDANLKSSVEIDTLTNNEGDDVFDMFYVCFAIHRRSWKLKIICGLWESLSLICFYEMVHGILWSPIVKT